MNDSQVAKKNGKNPEKMMILIQLSDKKLTVVILSESDLQYIIA